MSILALSAALAGATAAPSDVTELAYIGKVPQLHQPALYLINSDGTNRRLITRRGGVSRQSTFSWSPDGRQLAFSGFVGGDEDAKEIFLVNEDGSGLRQLTHSSGKRKRTEWDWSTNPTWSPDGKLIAFQGARECFVDWCEISQIFVIHVDGTGERKLTRSSRHNVLPAWSPDGSKILFERYGGRWSTPDSNGFIRWIHNGKLDLYTIDPGSGRKQKFARIENERDHCACAAWSPDGSQIVYEAAGTKGRPDIYVMNADGSGRQRLTHDPARDENPDWSPDGSQIAFYSERPGDAEIYIMNTDGTKQHRITRDPWYDQAVRWKPAPNGG